MTAKPAFDHGKDRQRVRFGRAPIYLDHHATTPII
jgi:hypothetical protein